MKLNAVFLFLNVCGLLRESVYRKIKSEHGQKQILGRVKLGRKVILTRRKRKSEKGRECCGHS